MSFLMMGKKLGMTRVYTDKGAAVPVTVIQVDGNVVTQIRSRDKDGYDAVQVGYGDVHARNSTIPMIGHDAKAGASPKRHHREFRVDANDAAGFQLGQALDVDLFGKVAYVDVAGRSKGKGFAGVMKRWHFKGMFASHGTERKHRSPGSIGSLCSNRGYGGGLAKGKKMAGHMGDERVTVRSLDVVRVDPERKLLLVKGPVPGATNGTLEIRPAVRLYKTKAKKQKEVAG
ncbi:MAG TPA: 50S ribosomal protein L3 [Phycisphaerales bacterium]|nr:50S ribosomal protein L3 [Phycisphaerales bacterium]